MGAALVGAEQVGAEQVGAEQVGAALLGAALLGAALLGAALLGAALLGWDAAEQVHAEFVIYSKVGDNVEFREENSLVSHNDRGADIRDWSVLRGKLKPNRHRDLPRIRLLPLPRRHGDDHHKGCVHHHPLLLQDILDLLECHHELHGHRDILLPRRDPFHSWDISSWVSSWALSPPPFRGTWSMTFWARRCRLFADAAWAP